MRTVPQTPATIQRLLVEGAGLPPAIVDGVLYAFTHLLPCDQRHYLESLTATATRATAPTLRVLNGGTDARE